MNPNSTHQLWSKWIITIRPDLPVQPAFAEVQANAARFLRKAFGSAALCRVRRFTKAWVVEVLADAQYHPDDRESFTAMSRDLTRFFRNGFGSANTDVRVKARLMAGERMDGGAPDQMLMMPSLSTVVRAAGFDPLRLRVAKVSQRSN
jgi:hypothetical protein